MSDCLGDESPAERRRERRRRLRAGVPQRWSRRPAAASPGAPPEATATAAAAAAAARGGAVEPGASGATLRAGKYAASSCAMDCAAGLEGQKRRRSGARSSSLRGQDTAAGIVEGACRHTGRVSSRVSSAVSQLSLRIFFASKRPRPSMVSSCGKQSGSERWVCLYSGLASRICSESSCRVGQRRGDGSDAKGSPPNVPWS